MTSARYDVVYRTNIAYDDVVRSSQNELRACPMSDEFQQLVAYRVVTYPSARVLSYQDYFGTRVDAFGLREPHVALEITAEASVETQARPLVTVSPRLAELRAPAFKDLHAEYLSPSAHTAWDDGLATAAERIRAVTGDDVVGVVLALHRFVHTSLRYTPGATYIGVDVNEVLAKAQGVCQDYAHLAVAMCRSVGIPARYVSGYFFAGSDATGVDVQGDEVQVQTHAWFEAAIPDWGWLALDPTNAQQVGPRHITIGHGRDYDDVPPVRGVYSGAGRPMTDAVVEMRRHAPHSLQSRLLQQVQHQQQQQQQ
ncbi:MAG: transglutaminase family protein [Actinomycetota bacterium]|nr:transglutaminase family protein [Actinomycetota bacterium]